LLVVLIALCAHPMNAAELTLGSLREAGGLCIEARRQ
jgi:hypothetical protein